LNIYADSSFIASLYIQDAHFADATRLMSFAPSVWISPLNRCELAHAIYQKVFRAELTKSEGDRAWAEFESDWVNGIWISTDMPAKTWDRSILLAERHSAKLGVRTLDSLHIACALELKAERFWTFDERQARLAEAMGLNTSA
jgi:predicted nucleic acid-binding protein